MKRVAFISGLFLLSGAALAQTSASFDLEEFAFNAGGVPAGGVELASAGYAVTLASIGEAVEARDAGSGSFVLDLGFPSAYPPPGEVAGNCGEPAGTCLGFTDKETLTWPPQQSAGAYNLYRDRMSTVSALGYGSCRRQDLQETTATEAEAVPEGDGFFYLVTVENRLGEEGTKGFRGDAAQRQGAVCP